MLTKISLIANLLASIANLIKRVRNDKHRQDQVADPANAIANGGRVQQSKQTFAQLAESDECD